MPRKETNRGVGKYMSKTIALLHTTSVTIEPLRDLLSKEIPKIKIINFLDDSILSQLGESRGDISLVEKRLVQYAVNAEQVGADIILNVCSSVGEVVEKMRERVNIPIIRIDEAMAEMAIHMGNKIGVVATLATTLEPTMNLLKQKSAKLNTQVELQSLLAEEAYQYLLAGHQEKYDRNLAESLAKIQEEVDVVVLAQASMARVVKTLAPEKQIYFLSSPEFGVEKVRQTLEELA